MIELAFRVVAAVCTYIAIGFMYMFSAMIKATLIFLDKKGCRELDVDVIKAAKKLTTTANTLIKQAGLIVAVPFTKPLVLKPPPPPKNP